MTYNAHCIAGPGGLTSSVSTLFPEEAVNEVKRQAMSELQKAVSEAERKAHEIITSERAKMERTVAEAKRQAAEDALSIINQQEDSSEVRTYKCIIESVTHPLVLIYHLFCHTSDASISRDFQVTVQRRFCCISLSR